MTNRPASFAVNPTLLGIAFKIAATMLFIVMGSLIKIVSAEGVPLGQIIFARNLFALPPIIAIMLMQGEFPSALRTSRPGGHALRALIGGIGMAGLFGGFQYLSLPDATAIGYAAPIFSVVLAALVLREVVGIYRWSAVAVGFVGVVIMLSPYLFADRAGITDREALGALMATGGAFASAGAIIQIRRLTATERTGTIVFYFAAILTVASLLTAPFGWVWLAPLDLALLVLIGLVGGLTQICVTQGYRLAQPSLVAPFDYLTMIWSVMIGYFFFSETPTTEVLFGAVLVVGAGLFVIYREARLGIDRSAPKKAKVSLGD